MMIHPNDPSIVSAAIVTGSAADEATTFDRSYRLLTDRGLSSVEAGNILAFIAGLHPAERGWTVQEIKDLVVLRAFVAGGFIDS
jgi:hypothetical protein